MAPADVKASADIVTPKLLRRMAGERFFARGEAYFAAGVVRSLRAYDGGVKAVVQGTRRYRVHLWAEDDELGYDCSCPVGREGEFCKHCVAVGLALHAGRQGAGAGDSEDTGSEFREADVRAYLSRLDKEELVSLLLEQADEDERLHRRLTLQAARATSGTAPSSAWKDALADALETDGVQHARRRLHDPCGRMPLTRSEKQTLDRNTTERRQVHDAGVLDAVPKAAGGRDERVVQPEAADVDGEIHGSAVRLIHSVKW